MPPSIKRTGHNPLRAAQTHVDRACAKLGLGESARRLSRRSIGENRAPLPLKREDDEPWVYRACLCVYAPRQAFRVPCNNARGPTKGVLRGHANETIGVHRRIRCDGAGTGPRLGGGRASRDPNIQWCASTHAVDTGDAWQYCWLRDRICSGNRGRFRA